MIRDAQEPVAPYRVSFVPVTIGHDDDGEQTKQKGIASFSQAIALAWKLTEEDLGKSGSFEKWLAGGSVGLVYDSLGLLVWDGLVEAVKRNTA